MSDMLNVARLDPAWSHNAMSHSVDGYLLELNLQGVMYCTLYLMVSKAIKHVLDISVLVTAYDRLGVEHQSSHIGSYIPVKSLDWFRIQCQEAVREQIIPLLKTRKLNHCKLQRIVENLVKGAKYRGAPPAQRQDVVKLMHRLAKLPEQVRDRIYDSPGADSHMPHSFDMSVEDIAFWNRCVDSLENTK